MGWRPMGRAALILGAVIALSLVAAAGWAQEAAPPPPKGPDAPWWGQDYVPRAAEHPEVRRTSRYVTLRDGVRLAVDVYRAATLPDTVGKPTLLEQTRYYRSSESPTADGPPCTLSRRAIWFAERGYNYVIVDVRGTGASFGYRQAEFGAVEVRDGADVVDWIVAQPWSDGTVGATGVSYVGTTAELLLRNRHPAVKAIAPQFAGYDFYAEINFPGGVRNQRFIEAWGALNRSLDAGRNPPRQGGTPPCPVDGPDGPALREQAIAEHAANVNSADAQAKIVYRDDRGINGLRIADRSPYSYQAEIDADQVPVLQIGSWMDVGYTRGAFHRLLNSRNANLKLLIGAWNHGGNYYYAPGVEVPTRPTISMNDILLRFFDHHLMGIATGQDAEPRVRYFTTGANAWRVTDAWPPADVRSGHWCFAAGGGLDPACAGPAGEDRHVVRADTAAGTLTRWDTALRSAVAYPDRRSEDEKLLTYTSPALDRDLEITGNPHVQLTIATDADDATIIVYLEEVTADGRVFMVTEGLMRLSLSRPGATPYRTHTTEPSYLRADARQDVRGQPIEAQIPLFPVSHLFKAGSSLRIAIAGLDGDRFAGGTPGAVWRVQRGGPSLSAVTLPIRGADAGPGRTGP